MSAPRVLYFDSGLGGLSLVESVQACLPTPDWVYLADNACFPYGELTEAQLQGRCLALCRHFTRMLEPDMLVVACNTASTLVLPALRAALSIPVVGVVPAIKPAAAVSRNRRIGLLATPATVRRPYIDQLIRDFAADCEIVRVGSSRLVTLAEYALQQRPDLAEVAACVAPLAESDVDTLVLGCTHFPLIKAELRQALPAVSHWVDSGEAIARRVASLWEAGRGPQRQLEENPRLLFTGEAPQGLEAYLKDRGWAPRIEGGISCPGD